jgi:hypothetical protein
MEEGVPRRRVDGRRRVGAVGLAIVGRRAGHANVQAKRGQGEGCLPKMHLMHCVAHRAWATGRHLVRRFKTLLNRRTRRRPPPNRRA